MRHVIGKRTEKLNIMKKQVGLRYVDTLHAYLLRVKALYY
jgi:hypothetical protein